MEHVANEPAVTVVLMVRKFETKEQRSEATLRLLAAGWVEKPEEPR